MPPPDPILDLIIASMKERGITQEWLAARLGMRQSDISRKLTRRQTTTTIQASAMLAALGLSLCTADAGSPPARDGHAKDPTHADVHR